MGKLGKFALVEIIRTSDYQLKLREELEVSQSDLTHADVSEEALKGLPLREAQKSRRVRAVYF
jgi:hypothetical protein